MAPDDSAPYRPTLYGGSLALDFANTAAGRGSELFQERLTSRRMLADWSLASGLISESVRKTMDSTGELGQPVRPQAIELREAIHGIGAALARGEPPAAEPVGIIKRHALEAMKHSSLNLTELGTLDWKPPSVAENLVHAEHHVALSALRTFLLEDPKRIRCCPGKGCGFVFLDRSKNGTRIWCDMAVCGNRKKAERNRRRAGE